MRVQLVHVGGAHAGERFSYELGPAPPAKQALRFGRGADNDVVFDAQRDLAASTSHAELLYEPGSLRLRDLDSSNGTLVNGMAVRELALNPGDLIEFGKGGPRVQVSFDAADLIQLPPSARALAVRPLPGGALANMPVSVDGPTVIDPRAVHPLTAAPLAVTLAVSDTLHTPDALAGDTLPEPTAPPPSLSPPPPRPRLPPTAVVLAPIEPAEAASAKVGRRTVMQLIGQAVGEDRRKRRRSSRLLVVGLLVALAVSGGAMVRLWTADPPPLVPVADTGSQVARRSRGAIFMLAARLPEGRLEGFCTAFAILPRVLGTNAHCLTDFERWQEQRATLWVVQNGHADRRHEVIRRVAHASYSPVLRGTRKPPDVALLFVAADLPRVVPVASLTELQSVGAGTAIYAYGFPGRFMRAEAPEASFVDGRIGRVTTLDETVGPFGRTHLIQHTAVTHGGTSGSPLFNEEGRVIAINAGTYNAAEEELLLDPKTGRPIMQVSVAGRRTGYKYAMRIDLLRELAQSQGLKLP